MAEFLTTSGVSNCIENIIKNAELQIVLISPYLQISKTTVERLKDASARSIAITIVYGKNDLSEHEKESIAQITNIKIYFLGNLHSKCYFNEKQMVLTSMNMYQFSEKNNREMGILINQKSDTKLFQDAVNESNSIIAHSKAEILKISTQEKAVKIEHDTPPIMGYCIRCKSEIVYSSDRPYCHACFCVWARDNNNIKHKEQVCHCCGTRNFNISMNKPICYNCNNRFPLQKKQLFSL